MPDPSHVLIEGGDPEFYCGAEDGRKVRVQFAVTAGRDGVQGVLRGMRFEPQ
jgi:hypothetical protein